jgi:hypothetical protein
MARDIPEKLTNRSLASQEILHILWKPKVHYRIQKCPPPVHTLSQNNPVRFSPSHFWKVNVKINLSPTPRSSNLLLLLLLLLFASRFLIDGTMQLLPILLLRYCHFRCDSSTLLMYRLQAFHPRKRHDRRKAVNEHFQLQLSFRVRGALRRQLLCTVTNIHIGRGWPRWQTAVLQQPFI